MELLHVQIMLFCAIDLLRAVTENCKLQLNLRCQVEMPTKIPKFLFGCLTVKTN